MNPVSGIPSINISPASAGQPAPSVLVRTSSVPCGNDVMERQLILTLYKRKLMKKVIVLLNLLLIAIVAISQDGNAGINEANTKVRSYFNSGTNLMYAVGAVLGLIGAVKVYSKWNSGDPDTGKVAAAWFGSCVFLVVVATVIRSFFGI